MLLGSSGGQADGSGAGDPGASAQSLSRRSSAHRPGGAQHGVGAESAALPGALLLPALPPVPSALRGHQAAEELGGQHGRDAATRATVTAPGAVGFQ